ncbi:hypothetical protein BV898_11340 [Hypsibius exemplaris]|uniref:Gustatory receptor n=1 Tax=Hypsibius exemplaris TaxID=2072580 RepID=A0A1W0WH21_HYPEX|nr:hypothetical protein BV898_11340 [Hypsibius exemplaris]
MHTGVCEDLDESIPDRLVAVIAAEGFRMKYGVIAPVYSVLSLIVWKDQEKDFEDMSDDDEATHAMLVMLVMLVMPVMPVISIIQAVPGYNLLYVRLITPKLYSIVLGLLHDQHGSHCSRRIRGVIVILVSALSCVYEVENTVYAVVTTKTTPYSGIYNIAEGIRLAQYPLKTITTTAILMVFFSKSSRLAELTQKARPSFACSSMLLRDKTRNVRKVNRISGTIFVTFAAYCILMIWNRVVRIVETQSSPGEWGLSDFPWPKLNWLQTQVINFFMRNTSEAIRLLCSGYLSLLLYKFSMGLASDCQTILDVTNYNYPTVSENVLMQAWDAREDALKLAAIQRAEMGTLLWLSLTTDILCLSATCADFLFVEDYTAGFRNVAQILLYTVSLMSVSMGLISLTEQVLIAQYMYTYTQRPHRPADGVVASAFERTTRDGSYDVLRLVSLFKSSCFGTRRAVPIVPGFGYVTTATIFNALGLLFTFICFMMDQYNRSLDAVLFKPITMGTAVSDCIPLQANSTIESDIF